jgi:5-methyltetrahydropteroyltriglutamate--homocysteine methyltransferase
MNRNRPPFRADHVGSLLRPPQLLQARERAKRGEISAAQLRAAEDDAIRGVVKMQEDVGLEGITDGELRRGSWHMDFLYQVGGATKVENKLAVQFHNEKGDIEFTPAALRVTGKLTLQKCIFAEDFLFLKSITRGTPKLTIPSPSMMHYRGGRAAIDAAVYPDLREFWRDLSAVYAKQIKELGKLGCTYLQMDDTSLAYLNSRRRNYAWSWQRRARCGARLPHSTVMQIDADRPEADNNGPYQSDLPLRRSLGNERWPIPPRSTVRLARYCWLRI